MRAGVGEGGSGENTRSGSGGKLAVQSGVPTMASVAYALWMETAAAAAWTHLAEAGIPPILLKGPAIARWLYEGEARLSLDIDLLVSPANFERAQAVLGELGYSLRLAGSPDCEVGPNTRMLVADDGLRIDLHRHLIGVPDPPERCWNVLSKRTVPFPLHGAEVQVLDVTARTMHLAMHAAQNGPIDAKPLVDLNRGLAQVDFEVWQGAARLAEELEAMPAFAAGLRLTPDGAELADKLALPHAVNVELALRIASAPQESLVFVRLGYVRGLKNKACVVARKLWPTAGFMRMNSALARRGPLGLLIAHLLRPLSMIRRGLPALLALRRARALVRQAKPS